MKVQNHQTVLKIMLWIAQGIIALVFLVTGSAKLFLPLENLNSMIPWTIDVNELPIRLIGFSEILGAIGLVFPALLRFKPQLTPWAAVGVAFVMMLAIVFNVLIGETHVIGVNIVLLMLSIFVAVGRFKHVVILPKDGISKDSMSKNYNNISIQN